MSQHSTTKPDTFEEGNQMPNDNMGLSIAGLIIGSLGTYCIGMVIGALAIFFSYNVRKYFANNDIVDAQKSAKTAKTLAIIGLVIGVIGIISQIYYQNDVIDQVQGYLGTLE